MGSAGVEKYSRIAVILHWIVALLIIFNLALGFFHEALADEMIRPAINLHKSVGVTVLGLVLMRILWRLSHKPPPFSAGLKPWEKTLAHITHYGLYVLMLAMPLTGWLHDSAWNKAREIPMYFFGLFEWPRFSFIMDMPAEQKEKLHDLFGLIHWAGGWFLVLLLALHIAGALKHQLIDKDAELQRMTL